MTIKEMPRCSICNVPLGESNNKLFVEEQWVHYTCAFNKSISQEWAKRKIKNSNEDYKS